MSHPKDVTPDHPVLELITRRWSPRAFADRPVEANKLLSVLEAARWAPSSGNVQPWRFIVGQKGDKTFEKIVETLKEGNRPWAKDAPVLMLSVAEVRLEREGKPSRDNRHAFHDVGLATANLVTQATELGLYVHQMGGFEPEKARELFDIPLKFEAATAIALGYLGEADQLSDKQKERERAPRSRKNLKELVFADEFGQTADFIS